MLKVKSTETTGFEPAIFGVTSRRFNHIEATFPT